LLDTAKADGKAEGRADREKEIARNLLSMGMSIADIVKATGLTIDEVEELNQDPAD
jgi:predicted transposase/invertase (TIGR01784 family)